MEDMLSFSASPSCFPEQDAMNKDQREYPCTSELKNHTHYDSNSDSEDAGEAVDPAERFFYPNCG